MYLSLPQSMIIDIFSFSETKKENKTFYNCYCVEVKTTSFWMTNHFHRSNQGPNCFGASFEVDLFLKLPCVLASGSRNYVQLFRVFWYSYSKRTILCSFIWFESRFMLQKGNCTWFHVLRGLDVPEGR